MPLTSTKSLTLSLRFPPPPPQDYWKRALVTILISIKSLIVSIGSAVSHVIL
jgi:hypothetical protein